MCYITQSKQQKFILLCLSVERHSGDLSKLPQNVTAAFKSYVNFIQLA